MKSDFKRFRRLSKFALVLMVMAVIGFAGCVVFVGGWAGAASGITALILVGCVAAFCECAAYDCLICPHCGQRAVKPHREFPRDQENVARFRAICRGQPFECVHCKRTVETA